MSDVRYLSPWLVLAVSVPTLDGQWAALTIKTLYKTVTASRTLS